MGLIVRQASRVRVADKEDLCYIKRMLSSVFRQSIVYMGLAMLAVILTAACTTVRSHSAYEQGQIIDLTKNIIIPFSKLRPAILDADVVYIGEAHYTPSHIEAALRVLKSLLDKGRTPILGMEMFSWDGQTGLNRFLNGEIASIDNFLAESQWKNNWGGKYEDYSPLVDFAKNNNLELLALNPPRPLVRKVVQKGLTGIENDPDAQIFIPDPFPKDDPEYRRVIYEQIEKCHSGLKPEIYQKIYEASVFRDEGMASVITKTARLGYPGSTTFVSYTGAGHIQYGLPMPNRVKRQLDRPLKQVTIYLHALDPEHQEDVEQLVEEKIADFVWLTALGPHGRQPRCGE